MKMKLDLPFICEDIFDIEDYYGRDKNSGHHFKTCMTLDNVGSEIRVDTLTVALRKREKVPTKINTSQCKMIEYKNIIFTSQFQKEETENRCQ